MTCVLLTRPLEDALPLVKRLKEKGIETVSYPLFKPRFFPLPSLKTPQALIITSKNTIRAIEKEEELKELPLYVVGNQTAEFARSKGFAQVLSASGTSQELLPLILGHAHKKKGILWYLSGEVVKGTILPTLKSQGFQAERQIVYAIESVEAFPLPLHEDLQNKKISHIMFFSPHTASIFVNLLKKEGLENIPMEMTALCLSKAVEERVLAVQWKKKWVSSHPTTQSMIEYFHEER